MGIEFIGFKWISSTFRFEDSDSMRGSSIWILIWTGPFSDRLFLLTIPNDAFIDILTLSIIDCFLSDESIVVLLQTYFPYK